MDMPCYAIPLGKTLMAKTLFELNKNNILLNNYYMNNWLQSKSTINSGYA